eukprot:3320892-Lingulodinium_polyedra.AAC.1
MVRQLWSAPPGTSPDPEPPAKRACRRAHHLWPGSSKWAGQTWRAPDPQAKWQQQCGQQGPKTPCGSQPLCPTARSQLVGARIANTAWQTPRHRGCGSGGGPGTTLAGPGLSAR